ncbi:MAG: arylsulfatase A-like enzyme [Mariniblastus sp.]|jgi:arylsulfatase A-like enzyme
MNHLDIAWQVIPRFTLYIQLACRHELNPMNALVHFLIAILVLTAAGSCSASDQPPNIVFFFVDDMGWQDTSVPFHTDATQLNRDYRTPNMEKLAAQGLLFSNAYACSICSPSRVSLMTGQNAARHKVTCWTLRKDTSPARPPKEFKAANWNLNGLQSAGDATPRSVAATTLPELLRTGGYHTIHAGKGHFGAQGTPGADPLNLGFDVNIAGSYMGGPGSYHGDHNFSAEWRGGGRIWDVPGLEKYHGQKINLTEAITREVISEIEKAVAAEKPFYLYMSHYAVHAPFEPDRRFLPNYSDETWSPHKKKYASMLESMDRSLGDLMGTVDRLGIADKTIIVFMSDNGSPSNNPRNLPLRGHKISGYEGGNRVPLIVDWPDITAAGKRNATPVIVDDIFPTLLEMAGLDVPKNDGQSWVPILRDNTPPPETPRELLWHYPNFYNQPPYSSLRLGDWKLIYWHKDQSMELFNLVNDIGESINVADKHPDRLHDLATRLTRQLKEKGAQFATIQATGDPVPYPADVLASQAKGQ